MIRMTVSVDDDSRAESVAKAIGELLSEHGGGHVVYTSCIQAKPKLKAKKVTRQGAAKGRKR